jgi:hypothetical protein
MSRSPLLLVSLALSAAAACGPAEPEAPDYVEVRSSSCDEGVPVVLTGRVLGTSSAGSDPVRVWLQRYGVQTGGMLATAELSEPGLRPVKYTLCADVSQLPAGADVRVFASQGSYLGAVILTSRPLPAEGVDVSMSRQIPLDPN